MTTTARVIESYTIAYPNPIKLKEGETVLIEKWEPKDSQWAGWAFCIDQRGIKGWVSETYLYVKGNSAVAARDYDATELTVQCNEMVKVHHQEFGWAWVENSEGAQGWVPLKILKMSAALTNDFFIGEIILESLVDPSVLEPFRQFLVSSRTADVQDFVPSRWHIHRYRMPLDQVRTLIPGLENNIDKNQWYIHFYSEDTNQLFVVLSGRTFELPKQKDAAWNEMIAYGENVGVGRRWTENIPVDFHKE